MLLKDLLNDNMKALLNVVTVEPETRRTTVVEEIPYLPIYITPIKINTPKHYSMGGTGWICQYSHVTGCTICPATRQSKTEDKVVTAERCTRCVLRTRKDDVYARFSR